VVEELLHALKTQWQSSQKVATSGKALGLVVRIHTPVVIFSGEDLIFLGETLEKALNQHNLIQACVAIESMYSRFSNQRF